MTTNDPPIGDRPDNSSEHEQASRRRFLKLLGGAAGVAVAVPMASSLRSNSKASPSAPKTPGRGESFDAASGSAATASTSSGGERILVVVQLAGGNDGLNTVVPIGDPQYSALRGNLALRPDELTMLDRDFGLYAMPRLAEAWSHGNLAVVHGVGVPDPNLSHFVSMDVWMRGSADPGTGTGWIGRALDQLPSGDDPLIGVSIGDHSPTMWSDRVTTASLPGAGGVLPWSPLDQEEHGRGHAAQLTLSQAVRGESPLQALVRSGHRQALAIGDRVGPLLDRRAGEPVDDETGGILTGQLAVVGDLIKADYPTRAFHVSQGGYDTHDEQAENHPILLGNLDSAIGLFLASLGPKRSDVVVMMYSEFGRRLPANGSGTDHGTASVGLVVGDAVLGDHYGEPVNLNRLDANDNLRPTIDFRDFLGGVTGGVLDVDPTQVAPGAQSPITVV
ncbi:MAG: DUF1501 domain-containing protein [Actinomycetia bacterium]|nr:DUF1501 domain-containing protein [Actinomycetes bacterium]